MEKKTPSVWTYTRLVRSLQRTVQVLALSSVTPKRYDKEVLVRRDEQDLKEVIAHLSWMVNEIEGHILYPNMGKDKSMRWLGFIQGAMWALGLATLGELRKANKEEVPTPSSLEVDDYVIVVNKPEAKFRVARVSHGADPGSGIALLVNEDGSRHGWEDIYFLRKT